jgi:hypothetical protein
MKASNSIITFLLLSVFSLTVGAAENVWMRCSVLKEKKAAFKLEVILKGTPGESQIAEVLENGKSVFTTSIDLKESASNHLTVFIGPEFKLDINRNMSANGKSQEYLSSVYYPQSDKSLATPVLACKTSTNLARLNAGADWSRSLAGS